MKKVFVSLSFGLFLAFTSQAQTQPGTSSSSSEQQYGDEWSADQQYGDEWNADQQYGPEWDPAQPNPNETDVVEDLFFGLFRKK